MEKAKGKGLPREATHLAITFRLTEAYTEARGGPFTHPQLHSQRLSLCLKVHESSRQPSWIRRGPWLRWSSLIGGAG